MTNMLHRLILVALFAAAGLAGPHVLAAGKPAVLVYSAGIDTILNDDLDAGLHAAMVRLERNGLSLPPDLEEPAVEGLNLLFQVLMSRMAFQVNVDPVVVSPGPFPATAQLTVYGNSGASLDELRTRARALLATRGAPHQLPVENHPDLMQVDAPGGPPVYWGLVDDAAVLGINVLPVSNQVNLDGFDVPNGSEPLLGLQLNFSTLGPILEMAMQADPQMREATQLLTGLGLAGPDAMDISIACSGDSNELHCRGRVTNIFKHYGKIMPSSPLGTEELKVIPVDASTFDIQRVKLSAIPAFLDGLITKLVPPDQLPPGPDGKPMSPVDMGIQMAQGYLGINLKTQFFDYLGDTFTYYRSSSTGGDGFYGIVFMAELSNPTGMKQSLSILTSRIDKELAAISDGYVRFVDWKFYDDIQLLTVAFPGLPVPLQLTFGVAGNQLIAGMTPQAVLAAAGSMGSDRSILDNKAFQSASSGLMQDVNRVQYMDTGARVRDGYGLAMAAMTALGNYSRPMRNAPARIDVVMPSLNELQDDVKPSIMIQRIDGDDLLMIGTADRSMVVHMTAFLGELTSSPMLLAMVLGGVTMPALARARTAAQQMQDLSLVQQASTAVHAWSAEHKGELPQSLDQLVHGGYLSHDMAHGMLYHGHASGTLAQIKHPSDHMLISMEDGSDNVAVAFADGHVESMPWWKFQDRLQHTQSNHNHTPGNHEHE